VTTMRIRALKEAHNSLDLVAKLLAEEMAASADCPDYVKPIAEFLEATRVLNNSIYMKIVELRKLLAHDRSPHGH